MTKKVFQITKSTYDDILKAITNKKPEQGGIIGGSKGTIIDNFYYDEKPTFSNISSYIPNAGKLNEIINDVWKRKNVKFIGMIHSHLINNGISDEDIDFARAILGSSSEMEYVLMGICGLDYLHKLKDFSWYQVFQEQVISADIVIIQ